MTFLAQLVYDDKQNICYFIIHNKDGEFVKFPLSMAEWVIYGKIGESEEITTPNDRRVLRILEGAIGD